MQSSAVSPGGGRGCGHLVHFYDEVYPVDAACDFIASGLRAGNRCVVMLAARDRAAVERELSARGIDTNPDARRDSGAYQAVDRDDAMSQFVVGGRLDLQLAAQAMTELLAPPPQGQAMRVRLVGDPAAAMFAAGKQEDAIALEQLVDGLAAEYSAAVFCAYPIQDFCHEGRTEPLFRISAAHAALTFPERLWVQSLLRSAPGFG